MFLSFCNFYRRFIFKFAAIARSLYALLRGIKNERKAGKIGYKWQKPQKQAFKQLITAFTVEVSGGNTACFPPQLLSLYTTELCRAMDGPWVAWTSVIYGEAPP